MEKFAEFTHYHCFYNEYKKYLLVEICQFQLVDFRNSHVWCEMLSVKKWEKAEKNRLSVM